MNNSTTTVFLTLICSFLIILMQMGFALIATGFTRVKNAGYTMAMNMLMFAIGVLGYWAVGYSLQLGGNFFFLSGPASDAASITSFLPNVVLMNIAAIIPIGAMAERWKFKAFVIYGFFIAIFTYPLFANWVWGGGWLSRLGVSFGLGHGVLDFAGSSVVHMVGGFSALAGAIVLGPRMGKYRPDGTPVAIPGHHIPMAITGCMILFFGWFGFTSQTALIENGFQVGVIAVNTLLAAAAGTFSSLSYMWFLYGKPDLSLAANGLLGGLVAISASCAFVSPVAAVVIGIIAGIICCASVFFIDHKLKVDDPVGAVSVHGVCGAWGLISLGLFANGKYGEGLNNVSGTVKGLFYGGASQLTAQFVGMVVNLVFIFVVMYIFFQVLDKITPLRVSEEVEFEGLDQNEISVVAYPEFSIKTRR
jgi:Amt family ammonium transporter